MRRRKQNRYIMNGFPKPWLIETQEASMAQKQCQASVDQTMIMQILKEEDQFFLSYHHRPPRGRETEDVVDNAYSRLSQMHSLPYTEVDRIYREMRCPHA